MTFGLYNRRFYHEDLLRRTLSDGEMVNPRILLAKLSDDGLTIGELSREADLAFSTGNRSKCLEFVERLYQAFDLAETTSLIPQFPGD